MKGQFALIFLGAVLSGCCGLAAPSGLQAVESFEAERYLGLWYEVARLDHSFERGLSDVTATYVARPDGGIEVINRGFHEQKGEWSEVRGVAYFLENRSLASLKVSFFRPLYCGYHVLKIDPGYNYAVVSGSDRTALWILARKPYIPHDILAELYHYARQAGFPTGELIEVKHSRHKS